MTQYRRELQEEQRPLSHAYLIDMINSGARENWLIPSRELFTGMIEWARSVNDRREQFANPNSLAREMSLLGIHGRNSRYFGCQQKCYDMVSRAHLLEKLGIQDEAADAL